MSKTKVDLQELGLASGFVLGRHFLDIGDLHYGYWTPDLPVSLQNLPKAQRQYSEFLLSQIPEGAANILDVGCGVGSVTRQLLDAGHRVDCVSPSPFLTKFAKEQLGDRATFFTCRFEELTTDRRYDLVLFSESFQYVPMQDALGKALGILRDGGHILVSDFFRTAAPGRSPIGGGHLLSSLYDVIEHLPVRIELDLDITPQTAPTLQLVNDAMMHAVRPVWEMAQVSFRAAYPRLSSVLLWYFRKRIANLERKQFSGERTPANFALHKSYRLLRLKKLPLLFQDQSDAAIMATL